MKTYSLKEMKIMRNKLRPVIRRVAKRGAPVHNRFASLTACLNNIKDDGYVGGEAGVSEEHIQREYNWLKSLMVEFEHLII